ncbi:hypothetical protein LOK49_LG02G02309 [Camellia lanceoleosa]|uniref:Uncharacterized protein n=1 Tax=Camellia lanceoleosa TaxID=1840588 RepID=A0ACC0INK2_9ERIC|nr:hypothetical protein LOK49_LG02G02309 [Camellia lanceoleosa]
MERKSCYSGRSNVCVKTTPKKEDVKLAETIKKEALVDDGKVSVYGREGVVAISPKAEVKKEEPVKVNVGSSVGRVGSGGGGGSGYCGCGCGSFN